MLYLCTTIMCSSVYFLIFLVFVFCTHIRAHTHTHTHTHACSPESLDMVDIIHPNRQLSNYYTPHNRPPGTIGVEGGVAKGGEELMAMKNTVGVNHTTTPLHMNQIVVTNLTDSPRNSRTSFNVPADIGRSLKNLQTFKDLFVSRKRIAIGPVIREGGCSVWWVWHFNSVCVWVGGFC